MSKSDTNTVVEKIKKLVPMYIIGFGNMYPESWIKEAIAENPPEPVKEFKRCMCSHPACGG
jgi:hypothetical protein